MVTPIDTLRADELQRMFADWGIPVMLQRVTASASPATGNIAETITEYLVTALVSPRQVQPTAGTSLQHATSTLQFIMQTSDLPEGLALSTSRIVHNGTTYSVVGSENSGNGLVITISGQRV